MFTLIDGFTFLVTRDDGTFAEADGLYHKDTRHLTDVTLACDPFDLEFVGRDVASPRRSTVFYADTNPHVNSIPDHSASMLQTHLLVSREQLVDETDGLYETITVHNHSRSSIDGRLTLTFDTDFADVFEVRGFEPALDRRIETQVDETTIGYEYSYQASDGTEVHQTTAIGVSDPIDQLAPGRAEMSLALESQAATSLYVHVKPGALRVDSVGPTAFNRAASTDESRPAIDRDGTSLSVGNTAYDRTIAQSIDDLNALISKELGSIPLTGIPWFATVFGRDLLITAFQMLPVAPSIARDALRYLAENQGNRTDPDRDERAGKMFHEIRHGELARTGRIPHTPYYGSVDATPLWIVLLDEWFRWSGDEGLVRELKDPLERAIAWIEQAVERIGDDPFLYYEATVGGGLEHKAWRDSMMSVQFRDGEIAHPPLASVEVQGYLYDAFSRAGRLYRDVWGDASEADRLADRAAHVKDEFNEVFWLPDRRFYGAAKTQNDRVVDSHTSNVGHCLWSGIVESARVGMVIDHLLSDELYSGWGVRTMSTVEAGYSPVSYHVGSVWPHDNSLIALGVARYGFHDEAETIARNLFEASTYADRNQMPELFCGIDDSVAPVPFKPACVPQAWAAGASFALIRAVFDLGPTDADRIEIGYTPTGFSSDTADWIVQAWQDGSVPTDAGVPE